MKIREHQIRERELALESNENERIPKLSNNHKIQQIQQIQEPSLQNNTLELAQNVPPVLQEWIDYYKSLCDNLNETIGQYEHKRLELSQKLAIPSYGHDSMHNLVNIIADLAKFNFLIRTNNLLLQLSASNHGLLNNSSRNIQMFEPSKEVQPSYDLQETSKGIREMVRSRLNATTYHNKQW